MERSSVDLCPVYREAHSNRVYSLTCAYIIFWVFFALSSSFSLAEQPPVYSDLSGAHFELDKDKSWLRVLVFRGGLLGGLGHNHVISHHNISGQAESNSSGEVQVSLKFSVEDFVVDDLALRKLEGDDFPGAIDAKDRAGTRKNMLGSKLLAAERFPEIVVDANLPFPTDHEFTIDAVVTIKGVSVPLSIPVKILLSEGSFIATGDLLIDHSTLGLKPFQAALGALKVDKTLRVKFEIHGVAVAEKS